MSDGWWVHCVMCCRSSSLCSGMLPQPDLTLDGFYSLLTAIQEDLPRTTSPEAYYRTLPAAASVKKEIILYVERQLLVSTTLAG